MPDRSKAGVLETPTQEPLALPHAPVFTLRGDWLLLSVRTGLLPDSTQETGPHADHLALSPEQPAGTETFPHFLQEFASGHTVSSCLRIWVSVCQNPCQVCLSQPCCASPSQAQRKGGGPSHLALTEGAGARGTTDIPPSQHFHSQPRAAGCLT